MTKSVIITGSSGGIGQVCVQYFANLGFTCILLDAIAYPEPLPEPHRAFVVDLTSREAVETVFQEVSELDLEIHGVAHLAGITRDKSLLKMSDNEWQQVINVNLTGSFHVIQASGKLLQSSGGSIVTVGSTAAHYGNFGQLNYVASKGGIEAMTKTAARELSKYQIRVNCIIPGLISTPMSARIPEQQLKALVSSIPLGRVGEPKDVAQLVEFLISEKSSYITGASIKIDGGLKM